MAEIWKGLDALRRFGIFACQYGFTKCMRTAVCGIVVMLPLLAWHCRRREKDGRNGDLCFYSWFLLFPVALTGMSRLFFQRWSIRLQAGIQLLGNTWVSSAYFAVMLTLAVWWFVRKGILSRRVRRLYCWYSPKAAACGGMDDWLGCVSRLTDRDRWGLARWYLGRVRVYISDEGFSPFCGGLLSPYIVMPAIYLEPAEKESHPRYEGWRLTEQGRVLLCHELLHLKSGHILWLHLFALLRIYWWFNPLIYLCEGLLQQDMERACDEGCLYYTGVSEGEYGRLLLAVAAGQEPVRVAGAATFWGGSDYHSLKIRIGSLRGKCGQGQYRSVHRALGWCCAAMLALCALAVGATSYPRYTRLPELSLYDEQMRLVCNDSPKLREAVQVVDGYLRIDGQRLADCLGELEIEGEYVYLGYDTIMKVPGTGGGGNVGMIALEDYGDIFYLRAETWENDFMEFCLKYLL